MKLGKMLAVGAMALSVSFFSTACSMFESGQPEDEKDPFYVDADAEAQAKLKAEQEARAARGANLSGAGALKRPGALWCLIPLPAFRCLCSGIRCLLEPFISGLIQNRYSSFENPKVEAVADFCFVPRMAGVIIEGIVTTWKRGYNGHSVEKRALAPKKFYSTGNFENRMKVISHGEERPAYMEKMNRMVEESS